MRQRCLMVAFLFLLCCGFPAVAQQRKLQNKPFIDTRVLHYGFFIGVHDQGLSIENNGYIDPATGQQWFAENDRSNYGIEVGVLAELKLTNHIALRVSPSLFFGSKHLKFIENGSGITETQDMKSTYIALPVGIKLSAPRWNNYRPYVTAGLSGVYDLTTSNQTLLRANPFEIRLDLGLGCDFYLPFFKLIPELRFSLGLTDVLDHKRKDMTNSNTDNIYTQSVSKATSNMVSLILYFE